MAGDQNAFSRKGRPGILTDRAKESARRAYELALKSNNYWLGPASVVGGDGREAPADILNARGSGSTP